MIERTVQAIDGTPQIQLQGDQTEVQVRLLALFRLGWRIVPGSGEVRNRMRVVRVAPGTASRRRRDRG